MSENARPNGYLVIDCETSGLFDFSKPADADGQPRLAALAIIQLDADLNQEYSNEFFIKPDGWTIEPDAARVNGLSIEKLTEDGIPVIDVLKVYADVLDRGYVVVAFNAQFDCKVLRGEMRRAGMDDRFEATPNICVMRASTNVCKIPKAKGGGYKFPKLAEACNHFLISQDADHSAMGDARAALAIFRKLREMGACPDPEVHYAKNRPIPESVVESIKAFDPPKPEPTPTIGDNHPPGPIEHARETIETLGKWMADHPVIQTDADAREAKLLIDRAKTALESVETERDSKVRPLNEQVSAINAEYKALHNPDGKKSGKWGVYDRIFNELKARMEAYLKAEEDKRIEAARIAAEAVRKAEQDARDAEAREREAIENARAGEIGVDVMTATQEADASFKTFEQSRRTLEIAQVDSRFKVGGGFQKPLGLRTSKKLVLNDVEAAIKAIGLTEGIREAVLSSARDYRKLRGALPAGVAEIEERVL